MDTIPPPMLALVVEDLPPVADWLCRLLHNRFAGIDVRHADCVKDACDVVAQGLQPDLALVDLGLPDGNGTRVIECIKRHHPACMVVVTTLFADDEHLFPALRAGAQGYLLKDQPEDKRSRALEAFCAVSPPCRPPLPSACCARSSPPCRKAEAKAKLSRHANVKSSCWSARAADSRNWRSACRSAGIRFLTT